MNALIKLNFTLASLLLLVGCGGPTFHGHNMVQIDPQFQPIVDRFVTDAAAQGKTIVVNNLIVQWGDLGTAPDSEPGSSGIVMGNCSAPVGETPVVTLNSNPALSIHDNWDNDFLWPAAYKRSLVYHELGHCLLGLKHDVNTWKPEGQDTAYFASLMYPNILDGQTFSDNEAHYLRQLFTGQN